MPASEPATGSRLSTTINEKQADANNNADTSRPAYFLGTKSRDSPVALRQGVWELLRVDWGPGYRVYDAMEARSVVLLLRGGDKRRQSADIDKAVDCWNDDKRRMQKP